MIVPFLNCAVCGNDPVKRQTCEACDQSGQLFLTSCPREFVADVVDTVRTIDVCERFGALPTAGGMLDQTAAFVDVVRILGWAEHEIAEMKKGQA